MEEELKTNKNVFTAQRDYAVADKLLQSFSDLSPAQRKRVMSELQKIGDKKQVEEAVFQTKTLDQVAAEYANKTLAFEGLSTGIKSIDEYLLGLKEGDVVVIGAYTGLGKSTFLMNMAFELQRQGVNSCLFALEDGDYEVGSRATMLRQGNPRFQEKHEGNAYIYSKEGVPMLYKNKFAFSPAVEALVMAKEVKVIFLDMLNDILDPINDADADDFMVELKSLADRLGIILVVTARLREPKSMSDKGRKLELAAPNEDSIYGRSMIKFLATKIITISQSMAYPYQPASGFGTPEIQYVSFNIVKNRVGYVTKKKGGGCVLELIRGTNYIKFNDKGFKEFVDA